jgi:hypothetical protein
MDVTSPFADSGEDTVAFEDSLILFNASGSSDNVGITSYAWDIDAGDGLDWANPDYTGISVSHIYTDAGNYLVTLRVLDAQGNSDTDSANVLVEVNDITAPVLNVILQTTMDEDLPYEFNASRSSDDIGIVSYFFSFGDGTNVTGSESSVTNTYDEPGVYVVVVNITDAAGNWNASSWLVTVHDTTPPMTPADPAVSKEASGGALNISWVPNLDDDLDHLELFTSSNGVVYTSLGEFAQDVTYYFHSGLTNGQNYSYYLVAYDTVGLSSPNSGISTESPERDMDEDGIFDSEDSDDDGDNVDDEIDAFPLNGSEWSDLDGDGIGDNSDIDIDGDGYDNENDAFPLDQSEWVDTDEDGIGNNEDTDDDEDGRPDSTDKYPLDKSKWKDPFDFMNLLWILIAIIGLILAAVLGVALSKVKGRNRKLLQRIDELEHTKAVPAAQPVAQPVAQPQAAVPAARPVKPAQKPKQAKPPVKEAEPAEQTFELIDEEPAAAPPPAPPPEEPPPPEPAKEKKKAEPPPPPE